MKADEVITLENIVLDYPRKKKGFGMFRVYLTGRVKRRARKDRWLRALNGIDLSINTGEVVGLIGPNGSGKSTLLRVIAGIYAPDEGKIRSKGRPTLLAGVGTGFQQDLTGRENIKLTASIYGLSKKETAAIEEPVIDFSGIRDFIDDPIRTYSSGMKARLGFAIISR